MLNKIATSLLFLFPLSQLAAILLPLPRASLKERAAPSGGSTTTAGTMDTVGASGAMGTAGSGDIGSGGTGSGTAGSGAAGMADSDASSGLRVALRPFSKAA